jgi:hypothetical protein
LFMFGNFYWAFCFFSFIIIFSLFDSLCLAVNLSFIIYQTDVSCQKLSTQSKLHVSRVT